MNQILAESRTGAGNGNIQDDPGARFSARKCGSDFSKVVEPTEKAGHMVIAETF